MRKKLKDDGGLTLVETLCAVAILILLCLLMNTGLNMALRTYRALTAEAETQLLLNSLTDALADKLRYCVVYENMSYSIGSPDLEHGKVVVKGTAGDGTPFSKALLPDAAYGEELAAGGDRKYLVEAMSVTPAVNGSEATFTVELKVRETSGDISAETPEGGLVVRCLNPVR